MMSALFDFLTILGSLLGIYGFLLVYRNTKGYHWQDINNWSERYFLYHPDYHEEKWAKLKKMNAETGYPSIPIDTPFEDVFLKSRNRNKIIGIICVISGLSIPAIQTILQH